jgi:hypothetical protein
VSSRTTTIAVDAILAAILSSYGMDTDPAEVPALRQKAAVGLSHALRVMARASGPGERFTLSSWAAQVQVDHSKPRKASR